MVSAKLALTALLGSSSSSLSAALPGNGPSAYSPPPHYSTSSPEKCHMEYMTKIFETSKPYTTVMYKTETTMVPVTKQQKSKQVVTKLHTSMSTQTSVKKTTVPVIWTKEATSTKKVQKAYQCLATTKKLETRTKTSTWTKRYPTSIANLVTVKKTVTHTSSGWKTKTKESVYHTWDKVTSTTKSACTETLTSKHIHTSHKLRTRTHTKIWTEVETIPVVQTQTVTKKHVYTTTKPVVTSTKCAVTTHITKKVPWTHTSLAYRTITSTKYRNAWGTHTGTKTILATVKVPEVCTSTCSSYTKVIETIPVVHTSSKVRKIKETNEVPCTETSLKTKYINVPHITHVTSSYKTSCTETPMRTFKATTVLSHKVCGPTHAAPYPN